MLDLEAKIQEAASQCVASLSFVTWSSHFLLIFIFVLYSTQRKSRELSYCILQLHPLTLYPTGLNNVKACREEIKICNLLINKLEQL